MSSETHDDALVLVTGATGLVGAAVCDALARAGYRVRRALRSAGVIGRDDVVVGDIHGGTDWSEALRDVHSIVHLAARTHVMKRTPQDEAEYHRVNVDGTRRLAEQAIAARVRRFVFLSSVKVNGEATYGRPFRETDTPCPEDPYGRTKRDAEDLLMRRGREQPIEIVVLRSPLVYGAGVKGNFERLMRAVAAGVPLPLGAVQNRRSLIYVGNLADAIVAAIEKPQAPGRTYLVSDGEDMSTPELVRAVARALHAKPRLVTCPLALLKFAAMCMGKSAELARLTDSLCIDSTRIRNELGWTPPYSVTEGLSDTARWYHARVNDGARVEEAHRAL